MQEEVLGGLLIGWKQTGPGKRWPSEKFLREKNRLELYTKEQFLGYWV